MAKSETQKVGSAPTFQFGCESQGLAVRALTQDKAKVWLETEVEMWRNSAFRGSVTINSVGTYDVHLSATYASALNNVLSALASGDPEPLAGYMQAAERFEVLLLQSSLGESILRLSDSDRRLAATAFSLGVLTAPNTPFTEHFRQIRVMFAINPFHGSGINLSAAKKLEAATLKQLDRADATLKGLGQQSDNFDTELASKRYQHKTFVEAQKKEFADWFTAQKAELEATRDIYHKHVQTEAAAIYWEDKSNKAYKLAWSAFIAFGVMIAAALLVFLANLTAIQDYIRGLTGESATVSLTPVVVVTVPVLAYAWILRHLSRVFIQNLTVADDAAYRRLMTMTFLGLSNDPKSGVTQAERAIILNALFRPAPPNTTEDGPPTGLLDIITRKA